MGKITRGRGAGRQLKVTGGSYFRIKQNLGVNETQFDILVAMPVLTGFISRLFLGIGTEEYGGRLLFTVLMLATTVAVYLLSAVETYGMFLVAALDVGLAGGSFNRYRVHLGVV